MAEPTTPAAALTASGITVLGVATGLDPMLLLCGFIGGWWAQSYEQPPAGLVQRLSVCALSALLTTWFIPPLVLWVTSLSWWPDVVPAMLMRFPAAVTFGLLAYKVLGPFALRFAKSKTEEIA